MPKLVLVFDPSVLDDRAKSARGAAQTRIPITVVGMLAAKPIPTGTCQNVTPPTAVRDPPAWNVTENGINGPPNSFQLNVPPSDVLD